MKRAPPESGSACQAGRAADWAQSHNDGVDRQALNDYRAQGRCESTSKELSIAMWLGIISPAARTRLASSSDCSPVRLRRRHDKKNRKEDFMPTARITDGRAAAGATDKYLG